MGITKWYGDRAFEEKVDPETIRRDAALIGEDMKSWFEEMKGTKPAEPEQPKPDAVSKNQ